jgi:heme-degrading monooxygenase HmoA
MRLRQIVLVTLLLALTTPMFAKTMVARMWRGRTTAAKADEYEKYLATGVAKLRATPGNIRVETLRRDEGKTTEFIVISYWPSRKEIHAYAGADIEKVHHLPRDKEFLIKPEEYVRHYDVKTED